MASFFDDVIGAVVGIVTTAVGIVHGTIAGIAAIFALIGFVIADVIHTWRTVLEQALGLVLPGEVAKWVTLSWYLIDTGTQYGAAFLQNLANALRTGKISDILDVVTPALVVAVKNGAREARPSALEVPKNVLRLIPDAGDRAWIEEKVRYTTIQRIDDKRFVYVWNEFKGHVEAITLIDTIVFVKPPDFQDSIDVFVMLHELKHTLQYRDMGVDVFIHEYIQDRGTQAATPRFENEADLYACSIMPYGHPRYIGTCFGVVR